MFVALPPTLRVLAAWLIVMGVGLLVWLGISTLPLSGLAESAVRGTAVVSGVVFAVLVWLWVFPRKPRSV